MVFYSVPIVGKASEKKGDFIKTTTTYLISGSACHDIDPKDHADLKEIYGRTFELAGFLKWFVGATLLVTIGLFVVMPYIEPLRLYMVRNPGLQNLIPVALVSVPMGALVAFLRYHGESVVERNRMARANYLESIGRWNGFEVIEKKNWKSFRAKLK